MVPYSVSSSARPLARDSVLVGQPPAPPPSHQHKLQPSRWSPHGPDMLPRVLDCGHFDRSVRRRCWSSRGGDSWQGFLGALPVVRS